METQNITPGTETKAPLTAITPEAPAPAPTTKAKAPKTRKAKTPKAAEIDLTQPGNYKLGNAEFYAKFPEVKSLFERLSGLGAVNFKFDFGYSATTRPSKRIVHVAKFNAPANWPGAAGKFPSYKKGAKVPEALLKGGSYQFGSKAYGQALPEMAKLFARLTKEGFGSYRLNVSYAMHDKPQRRIEFITKVDAPSTWIK